MIKMETQENNVNREYRCGHRPRGVWIFLGIVGFTALVFLFGAVIMWLWNWLFPAIFHLGMITYWQAVGLAVLGRLLFGFSHHGHHHGYRGRYMRRWHRRPSECSDYSNGAKWSWYEQFWSEEGEKAFDEYVKKKREAAGAK
jgi:hypothetical protein